MEISTTDLIASVKRFNRVDALRRDLTTAGHSPHVDTALILAIGSRETNLRNVVGDNGHGRGFLQIDDRYNPVVLAHSRGCQSGSWDPVYPSALTVGRVPTMMSQVHYAVATLEAAVDYAERNEVPEGRRLRYAVSAWNAGFGGALKGWHDHGNSDAYTTHGNYAADVLARADVIRVHRLDQPR